MGNHESDADRAARMRAEAEADADRPEARARAEARADELLEQYAELRTTIKPETVDALVEAMTTYDSDGLDPRDMERLLKRADQLGTVPSPAGLAPESFCSGYAGPDTSEPWQRPRWWQTLREFLPELRGMIAEEWEEAEYQAGLKARHRRRRKQERRR